MAFLFVVNRATGEDVRPIEERPVPRGDVAGKVYAPTRPFTTKPAPLLDQSKKPPIWRIADIVGLGQFSRLWDDAHPEGGNSILKKQVGDEVVVHALPQ